MSERHRHQVAVWLDLEGKASSYASQEGSLGVTLGLDQAIHRCGENPAGCSPPLPFSEESTLKPLILMPLPSGS